MSQDVRVIDANLKTAELVIPSFGSQPTLSLSVTKIREAEARLHEAQVVNPGTYANLEYTYGEGFREAKRHVSVLGYQITQAQKAKREASSRLLLDEYPTFLKANGFKDSAAIRDAFLEKSPEFTGAQDRIDMLTAMLELIKGKIEVFENTCRYMKKEMDLTIRSGVNTNKYGNS